MGPLLGEPSPILSPFCCVESFGLAYTAHRPHRHSAIIRKILGFPWLIEYGHPQGCLGGSLPSQKQLKWSQLKVGVTVIVASVILTVLGVLMSGTGGLFTKTILLRS